MRKVDFLDIFLLIFSLALSEWIVLLLPAITLFGIQVGTGTLALIVFVLLYLARVGYNQLVDKIATDVKNRLM